MKTKMKVLKSTDEKGSTSIISIPGSATSEVLKFLHERRIPTDYMGLDQSGRILMEIYLDEKQAHYLKKINEHIKACEEFVQSVTQAYEDLLKKHNDKIERDIREIMNRHKERKQTQTSTVNENGNEQK